MRLINTTTLAAEEFIGSDIPEYAILSHTWEDNEATYADWTSPGGLTGEGSGKLKIRASCSLAQSQGYDYIWVDTCCIDKSSSAELTEAINSMFQWYKDSSVCYVYLSDLGQWDPNERLEKCRWLTRGWTLQELIAPTNIQFYDQAWISRGTKTSLALVLSETTKIEQAILLGAMDLESIPVARKMAWAALRNTTRVEDMAYCLLGIFDVNMPLIYGEGSKAFIRLQEEIIKQTNDLSILGWSRASDPRSSDYSGLLAESPRDFRHAAQYIKERVLDNHTTPEFTITNKGIRINVPLVENDHSGLWFMCLNSCRQELETLEFVSEPGIWLRRYGDEGRLYARAKPREIAYMARQRIIHAQRSQCYLTRTLTKSSLFHLLGSRPHRFTFHWDSNSSYYQHLATKPASNWQHDEKTFITDRTGVKFVGIHHFKTTSNRWGSNSEVDLNSEFVLAFGLKSDGYGMQLFDTVPWFCIWKRGEEMFHVSNSINERNLDYIERHGMSNFEQHGRKQTLELVRHFGAGGPPPPSWLGNNASETSSNVSQAKRLNSSAKVSIQFSLRSRPSTDEVGWRVDIHLTEITDVV